VKLAFIGCGGIANAHARDLARLIEAGYDLEISYLIDPRIEAAERLRDKWGFREARLSRDYRDALGKVDAALVLTPHALHYRQCRDLLRSGVHVMVEKPMVCRLEEAYSLLDEASSADLILEVAYQRHFNPVFMALRDVLSSGDLGDVRLVSMILGQAYLSHVKGTWRLKPELSCGGELIDSGSHFIDAALWCAGKRPLEVFAYTSSYGEAVEIDVGLTARLEGGCIMVFTVAGNDPSFLEKYWFWCDKGRADLSPPRLTIGRREGRVLEPDLSRYRASRPLINFVKSVLGEEDNGSPGVCGLYTVAVVEAAYRSAREGRAISVRELCEEKGLNYDKYFP